MAGVGVIGGSGIYHLQGLEDVSIKEVKTPFGEPSSPIICGRLGNVKVFFIARHGANHSLMPNEVNYRANIFALKRLGVKWCISLGAVSSVSKALKISALVIPDQIIDFTKSRASTFFGNGICAHVPFGNPYCKVLRSILRQASSELAEEQNFSYHNGGTYFCIEGPTHLTKAESRLISSWGADVVGMTAMPEAQLAREAELGYASLVMITDYDISDRSEEQIRADHIPTGQLIDLLQKRVEHAKAIVMRTVRRLDGLEPDPVVRNALDGAIVTNASAIPNSTKEALYPILGKYL
jgi:5'-methylthioadenosine phosphorylase